MLIAPRRVSVAAGNRRQERELHLINSTCFAAVVSLAACAGCAFAQYQEQEGTTGNTNRAQSNLVVFSNTPDNVNTFNQIRGRTTGQSYSNPTAPPSTVNPDTFRLRSTSRPAGIYENTVSYVFLDASGVPIPSTAVPLAANLIRRGSDNIGQTLSATGFNANPQTRGGRWYSFGTGDQDEMYLAVGGLSTTNNDYLFTITSNVVTPISLGSIDTSSSPLSPFTLTTRGVTTAQTEMILLDSTYNQIRWNDNSLAGFGGTTAVTQSTIIEQLAAGTYYVGVSTNFAHEALLETAAQGEGNASTTPERTDFARSLLPIFPSVPTGGNDFDMQLRWGSQLVNGTSQNSNFAGVSWYSFTVVPAPSALTLVAVGGLFAGRRRRA